MAYGLPVEGEAGPFVGQHVEDVPTCGPEEDAAAVLGRLEEAGAPEAVVVNDEGVAIGLLPLAEAGSEDKSKVREVMKLIPSTIRPSVLMGSLSEEEADRALVTTSDGQLLGVVEPEASDEGPSREEMFEDEFLAAVEAIDEHFGDKEPTEEELRSFLRQRLMDDGKSAEEADRILSGDDSETQG